jgi:hypothetical protein
MPVAVFKHLRAMRGIGILADRDGKAPFVSERCSQQTARLVA